MKLISDIITFYAGESQKNKKVKTCKEAWVSSSNKESNRKANPEAQDAKGSKKNLMFPKKHRFSFRKYRLPKRILNSQSFSVRYDRNHEGLRLAVVVSKGVDKRATGRNKIKRIMLNTIQKNVETEEPLNLIFYVKKGALSSKSLEKEIEQAIEKIKNF